MAKRSKATLRKLGSKDCPYLLHCEVQVNDHFFTRVCNSSSYPICHHFARRAGELRTPLAWLQKRAVLRSREVPPTINI